MPSTEDISARSICIDISIRASMLIDTGDYHALIELLTRDFQMVRPSTYPAVSISGFDELKAAMDARPPLFVSRHICTNHTVDLVDDGVSIVRSYFVHYSGTRTTSSNQPLPLSDVFRSVGQYEDTLIGTKKGWRIARRVGQFIFGGV